LVTQKGRKKNGPLCSHERNIDRKVISDNIQFLMGGRGGDVKSMYIGKGVQVGRNVRKLLKNSI